MVSIRQLEKKDILSVVQIATMTMPYPWNAATFQDCLGNDYHAWVLELNNIIIGFVIVLLQADECQLMNIAIDPGYQRRGYASDLLQHAIKFAKSHGSKRLWLEVRKSNHPAIEFYQKWGGLRIAVRKNYYPCENGREAAYVFSIDLCLH